ncbi:hypothetical protein HDV63DRAFT_378348 [Trichoderma sp. SZMC 28014]
MNMGNILLNLDLLMSRNGFPFSGQLQSNRIARRNTPSGAHDLILQPGMPESERNKKLWIVDRILEPQTVGHFVESMAFGILSDGSKSSFGALPEDVLMLMQQPMATWAPAPYNSSHDVLLQQLMIRIGSHEDGERLIPIEKELHAMKSRLWEGVMPLSERRWQDLSLDSPQNFHAACQYIAGATNAFHYLNLPPIKAALRETYNLIWGHLRHFEDAFNAKNRLEQKPEVKIAARWHEYIKTHFNSVSVHAHRWVVNSVDRLRRPILEELAADPPSTGAGLDPRQWDLTNKLHDLLENAAQADSGIFLPMDGYEGESLRSQDDAPPLPGANEPYRTEPISFSANTHARKGDYYLRLKYLSRAELWLGHDRPTDQPPEPGLPTGFDLMNQTAQTSYCQVTAQEKTRLELRGPPVPLEQQLWVEKANLYLGTPNNFEWGYVAYRLSHDHTEEEWEQFKTKFEADVENWGHELNGVDNLRGRAVVHWRDAKDLDVSDDDVDALRAKFQDFRETADFPSGVRSDIFLGADKGVIDSYLHPTPEQGGFVMAIDVDFDPNAPDDERSEESPGYSGVLRVLGSVLWDDLGALLVTQTQHLSDLWPLAMNHPHSVYQGPLGEIQ